MRVGDLVRVLLDSRDRWESQLGWDGEPREEGSGLLIDRDRQMCEVLLVGGEKRKFRVHQVQLLQRGTKNEDKV